jgi:integrating conjugative element protein (TIGR03761 family)
MAIKAPNPTVSPVPLAPAAPSLVLPPAPTQAFRTEKNSPFSDGYSIAGESEVLAEFMATEARMHDENDPLYDRWIEFLDRQDRLERMQAVHATRKGADSVVEPKEVAGLNELGGLVNEEEDQMLVHTVEAYRMFMGRTKAPGATYEPIIGGEQTLREVEIRLKQETKNATTLIAAQVERGLKFSVLKSVEPKALTLGFKSPFGYAVASLITDFDFYVRLQKTLARKGLRTDDQIRASIADVTRLIRKVFMETARFERWLMKPEVKELSRADFLPQADAAGVARVAFATGVFGPVPPEVFVCKLQPSHSRRRFKITEAERGLLLGVGAMLERGEVPGKDHSEAGADVGEEAAASLPSAVGPTPAATSPSTASAAPKGTAAGKQLDAGAASISPASVAALSRAI